MAKEVPVLISAAEIQARVAEIGAIITENHRGEELLVLGILKGAFVFMADLVRAIDLPVICDFLSLSSYGEARVSSGTVKLTQDTKESLLGRHVLVVEDIVDTGNSFDFLSHVLVERGPASLKFCSLLLKPRQLQKQVRIDYLGFSIPSLFVIGYGLDCAGKYRNLPYLGIHPDEVKSCPPQERVVQMGWPVRQSSTIPTF